MNKDLQILKALILEMNATYKKSGLKHPEKADLDKNKKISSYEKKRGKAIEKNLKKEVDTPNPPTDYSGNPAIPGLGPIVHEEHEGQSNLPQSIEELPKHDGLYHIGGIINYDGSPWVSKADAEKALAMAKAEENPIKEDTSDLSYNAGYGAGARYGYDKGYNDCAAGKKYDQTGISKVRENHEGTDHEVSMANNSLDSILWAANELKKHLGDQERDIPAWIQDHITNAENYIIQAAKNFHDYGAKEAPEGDNTVNEYGDDSGGQDMTWGIYNRGTQKNTAGNREFMLKGYEDYYDGVPFDKCPFDPGYNQYYKIDLAKYWEAGWLKAKEEDTESESERNEMSLEEMIKKVGSKYNVYSKKGKKLGSHPSKKKAQKQMAAIEISKQGK